MAYRFYKKVSVKAVNVQSSQFIDDNARAYGVFLDKRELKTPGKQALHLAKKAHAELVAREWEAQNETIEPHTMPATRLVNVAIEQTPHNRARVIQEGCNYARSDLLCYHAEGPDSLSQRQEALWGPWIGWAKEQEIDLKVTKGIIAVAQDEGSITALKTRLEMMDDLDLTLCVHFTAVFGSAVLGLAVMAREITAIKAFDLSRLDAIWQSEKWGVDEEAQKLADNLRAEVSALSEFINE